MNKGSTKFRQSKDGEEAKPSLFVPFLSFCVFKDTTKGLRIEYRGAIKGSGGNKARRTGAEDGNGGAEAVTSIDGAH